MHSFYRLKQFKNIQSLFAILITKSHNFATIIKNIKSNFIMRKTLLLVLAIIVCIATILMSCTKDFIYDEDSVQPDTTYRLNIFNTDSLTVERYLRTGMWRPQSVLLVSKINRCKDSYKVEFDKQYLHELILGDVSVVFEFTEGCDIDAYFIGGVPYMTHTRYHSYHYDENKRILTMGEEKMQFSIVSIDDGRLVLLQKRHAYNSSVKSYLYIYELMTDDQKQQLLSNFEN